MWQLKTPDGIFNAETDAQLLDWAKKGRVQPSFTASNDGGQTWQSVKDLAFLDMRWSIDIGDGSLHGPINRVAAEKLLSTGRLAPGARLLGPGKELLEQIAKLEKERAALAIENAAAQRDKSAAAAEILSLKSQVEAQAQNRVAAEEKASRLESEIAPLREAAAQAESVKSALELAKQQVQGLETRLADAKAAEEKAKKALEDLERRNFELTGELERLPSNAAENADIEAAIYALMQAEAEDVDAQLQDLENEMRAAAEIRQARQEKLLARRRELITRLGANQSDMAQRALASRREDPRMQHLRQERDALRILQEKGMREANVRIEDLTAKLRERIAEVERLRLQTADVATLNRRISDLTQRLAQREKELMDERHIAEDARERAAAAEQTLTARISALENGLPGATRQSREARANNPCFPPWMGLKR